MNDNVRFLPNPDDGDEGTHIALTSGHACRVHAVGPDGKPGTAIPMMFRKQAVAAGCGIVGVEEPAAPKIDAVTRQGLIVDAMRQILDRENPDDLTGDGKPKIDQVKDLAGFNVTKKQFDDAYAALIDSLDD